MKSSTTGNMAGVTTNPSDPGFVAGRSQFQSTRWSMVLAAGGKGWGDARGALAELCQTYWYPLYAFARNRVGDAHQAQDLTQAFFAHLLEKQAIAKADRDRGRFRAFLLAAMKNFLTNEWQKACAEKRGGERSLLSLDFESAESRYQIEPTHELTPERLFERRWVLTLVETVLEALRLELVNEGKTNYFEQLKGGITGSATADDIAASAVGLGITPAAAKQAAYRLRKRYRELFREEVAKTVADESEVDDEIGRSLQTLGN